MLTIATWNVNSVKSRLEHLLRYLKEYKPDVVLLQELKCMTEAFPYMEVEELGYYAKVHGQKTYNGVAILSKYPVEDVITSFANNKEDEQARYIEGIISLKEQAIRVASIYVPNGQTPGSEKFAYKLSFFDKLYQHMQELLTYEEIMIIGGDYNVAPQAIDVFDPKSLEGTTCFHKDEREKFRALLYLGLTDAFRATNDNTQQFSWWDYRAGGWQYNKGMRIDHLLLSPQAADKLNNARVITDVRGWEKASDHTPVVCSLMI